MLSAVLAAGVVAGAAPAWVPEAREAAATVSTQAVQNTGLISDFLWNVGRTANGIGSSILIPIDAAITLPFDAISALLVGLQTSEYRADLASWLANRYLNPSDLYADESPYPYTYPNAFKNWGFENAIALLPPSAQVALTNFVNGIADRINGVLGDLANPITGEYVMQAFWGSGPGRVVESLRGVLVAPLWAVNDVVDYAGWLPYELFSTLEAAVEDPRDIPGLISNLAWGLLGPYGLVGDLIYDFSYPLTNLPGLVGQISTQIRDVVYTVLARVLDILPDPVSPYSDVEARVAGDEIVGTSADSTAGLLGSGPENLLTVANLGESDPVETETEAQDEISPEPAEVERVETEPAGSEPVDLAEPEAPVENEDLTDEEDVAGGDRDLSELTEPEETASEGGDTAPAGPSSTGGANQGGTAVETEPAPESESESEGGAGESAEAA